MAALCRLAVLSFLFGAALYPTVRIGVILYRLALAVFSRSVPKRRGGRILLSVLRGGLEGAAAVLVGVAFILFLYAAADGIPRLFSFVACGAGAFFSFRLLRGLLVRLEARVIALVRKLLLRLVRPVLQFCLRVFLRIVRFLSIFLLRLIKLCQRIYTKYTMQRYAKRAPLAWGARGACARVLRRGESYEGRRKR